MSHRNRCNGCGYPIITDADLAMAGIRATRTAAIHWRTCVGKRDWPEYMKRKRDAMPVETAWNANPYAIGYEAPVATVAPVATLAVSGEAPAPASTVLADVVGAGTAPSPEAAFDAISALGQALVDVNERDTCPVCGLRVSGGNIEDCDHVDAFDLGTFRAPCECGWRIPADSRNPEAAMRLHRAKAKQHKAVTSG